VWGYCTCYGANYFLFIINWESERFNNHRVLYCPEKSDIWNTYQQYIYICIYSTPFIVRTNAMQYFCANIGRVLLQCKSLSDWTFLTGCSQLNIPDRLFRIEHSWQAVQNLTFLTGCSQLKLLTYGTEIDAKTRRYREEWTVVPDLEDTTYKHLVCKTAVSETSLLEECPHVVVKITG
jgi:hypothetical protein